MSVYMLLVDGSCDQIVETLAIANREKRDLINLGFDNVKIKAFADWLSAQAYEDKLANA